jgi:hypothetical protein
MARFRHETRVEGAPRITIFRQGEFSGFSVTFLWKNLLAVINMPARRS